MKAIVRIFAAGLIWGTVAHAQSGSHCPSASTIIDVAERAGNFKTLLAAVRAAGLEQTLRTVDAATVFAPTDEAFAKLPEGTVESLLANIPALKDVLLYHVVAGRVPASVALTISEATTLNQQDISLTVRNDELFINESKVIAADVEASNGIIHVIDAVLIPQQ